jgi:hypothetical protein
MRINRIDRRSRNTPIISDKEIDEFARAVLEDYKPMLLREPGAIKFEHFLETYLGATILYKDIYHDDPERPIFGATAFRDSKLKVFDRESSRIKKLPVSANTVIIDNYVMQPGKEGLAAFTGLHEGGHILIHAGVFVPECDGQMTASDEEFSSMVYCHRGSVEGFGRKRAKRTAKEWLEHHADYFAAAIAMPNATFRPFVNRLLREHGFRKAFITIGRDTDLDILAQDIMPDCISEVYGVSRQAAYIKLKKAGFVCGC